MEKIVKRRIGQGIQENRSSMETDQGTGEGQPGGPFLESSSCKVGVSRLADAQLAILGKWTYLPFPSWIPQSLVSQADAGEKKGGIPTLISS